MSTYTAESNTADHTVAEVTAYLAKADPTEVERVKAQESAPDAQGRKGILEWAPNPSTVKPDADGYTRVLVEDAYQPGEPVESPEDPTGILE